MNIIDTELIRNHEGYTEIFEPGCFAGQEICMEIEVLEDEWKDIGGDRIRIVKKARLVKFGLDEMNGKA